ncbi:alpha/beta hydrolase [Amycolatopsis minnesotensis]|uniref:alpha/beta fold hydrolase n=1 Tax=Amycolatopsis minnesotensis TaxID=337894 RepID=UPI0031DEE8B7
MPVHELSRGVPRGPTVVLVHGLEASWDSWLPVSEFLDPRWRLLALDLPWRAGNDYAWRGRSPGRLLADALAEADEPPAAVVAHSFGANATLELLGSSRGAAGRAAAMLCPLYRPPKVAVTWEVFDRSRRAFDRHVRHGLLVRLGERAAALDPEIVETMADRAVDRVGPTGFLAVFQQFVDSTLLPLDRIGVPLSIVAGGNDPTLSVRAARELADALPTSTLDIDQDYDHFCHVKWPERVATGLTKFLDAHIGLPDGGR